MRLRRLAAGLAVLTYACVAATAAAAPASGGRHFPHFSLMNERVAVKNLPFGMRLMFGDALGVEAAGRAPGHGPVWFGEVERPNAKILAAGRGHWVCDFEAPNDEFVRGGGGACTSLAGARELGLLDVSSCGKGPPRHFRINGLVPNGVTGLEVEKADGTIGRTVPAIENTVAFTIGREDFTLHGVGGPAAEGLERTFPLAHTGRLGDDRPDCSVYAFAEAKPGE